MLRIQDRTTEKHHRVMKSKGNGGTDTAFSSEQYDAAYSDGMEEHWWSLARSRMVAFFVRKYSMVGSGLLEIGCGRGIVVKALRKRGYKCDGVELANVRPIDGVEEFVKVETDATELPLETRKQYRTILLLDVLEHIQEPESFLSATLAKFPEAELLMVSVPARRELWSNYDETYGHFRRYNLAMLDLMGQSIQARVLWNGYVFQGLYLPMLFITKCLGRRTTNLKPPGKFGWVNHSIYLIIYGLFHLIPRSIFGSSAIAIYRIRNGCNPDLTNTS